MLLKQAFRSSLKIQIFPFEIWPRLITDSERFTRLHTILPVKSAHVRVAFRRSISEKNKTIKSEVNQWNDTLTHSAHVS